MSAPEPVVRDLRCFSAEDLHALFADVYASSDAMSETLEE